MNDEATKMSEKILAHLKDYNHVWLIALTLIVVVLYIVKTALSPGKTEAEFTSNIIVCLLAAASVFGSLIALIAMAFMKKDAFKELDTFKVYFITGALVAAVLSAVKLLELFKIIKFAV